MNRPMTDSNTPKDKGLLERLAEKLNPPGHDVTDDELTDPGANIEEEKYDDRPHDPNRPAQ